MPCQRMHSASRSRAFVQSQRLVQTDASRAGDAPPEAISSSIWHCAASRGVMAWGDRRPDSLRKVSPAPVNTDSGCVSAEQRRTSDTSIARKNAGMATLGRMFAIAKRARKQAASKPTRQEVTPL